MEDDRDLFYHALNYRSASTQHADLFWRELQSCVNLLIADEREECAKECEIMHVSAFPECISPRERDSHECAKAIRVRSNATD